MTATTTLMGLLTAEHVSFTPSHGQTHSGLETGDVTSRKLRPSRWLMEVSASALSHDDAAAIAALVHDLADRSATFLAWDLAHEFPADDPSGAVAGDTVRIKFLNSDHRRLTLKGLAPGRKLTRGDYLGFLYSTSHLALHQVVDPLVTANNAGDTPLSFNVHPEIMAGVAVDDPVTLVRPCCEMSIIPGSFYKHSAGSVSSIGFRASQRF